MLGKIRKRLKKNDFIYATHQLLKQKKTRELLVDVGRNGRIFRFEHLGEENPEENIYFIRDGDRTQGMFSLVTWTLRRLEVADRFHFLPVVEWSPDVSYGIPGHSNTFLIYFQPVSGISVESAMRSACVAISNKWDRAYGSPVESYEFNQVEVDRLKRIYRKYIKLQPEIQTKIDREVVELLDGAGGKTLGVHVRGVDWRKKNVYNHPIPFTQEDYLKTAREMMRELGYERIFLASDSDETVDIFRAEFGDCLITADAKRTPAGSGSLAIFDEKNDPFAMGFEILRDAYVLAACDSLLCGLSYVSYGVRIINAAAATPYEKLVILDKGRAESGISYEHSGEKQRNDYKKKERKE